MVNVPPVICDFSPEAQKELKRVYAFLQADPDKFQSFSAHDAKTEDVQAFISEGGGELYYCPSCKSIMSPNRPCACD